MNEFSAIVDELTAWDSLRSAESAHCSLPAVDPHLTWTIAELRAELLNAAMLIAVTSSVLNSLERKPLSNPLTPAVSNFVPIHTSFFATATERILTECANADLCGALRNYNARLQFALMLNRHLHSKFTAHTDAGEADVEILSDAWRRMCKAAMQLNTSINDALAPNGGKNSPDSEAWLISILSKAELGGAPCVDEQGNVSVTGWAERRREKRVMVGYSARVAIGTREFEGKILDASASGLCFLGRAEEGQVVAIGLADGRKISGTVVWFEGDRFGVRFDSPLSPHDPLLNRTPLSN